MKGSVKIAPAVSLRRFHLFGISVVVAVTAFISAMVPTRTWAASANEATARWLRAFAEFTNWRETDFSDGDAPFVFGFLGENPFEKEIALLKSRPLRNRKVEVKVFKSVEEVVGCQMLFIASSEKRSLAKTLKALQGQHILTISDIEGFVQQGGVASVVVKQSGVVVSTVFPEINKEAVTKRGWDFRPDLLATIEMTQAQFR